MIEVRDLVVRFRSPQGHLLTALRVEELTAGVGEILTVAGASGSGKTTLLNVIAGLIAPTAGSVRVRGQEIGRFSEAERDRFRARSIGYVHQAFNLLPGYTALENVVLAMAFAGSRPRREQHRAAVTLLEQVGMGPRLHHRPAQLSGGEQQRVGIARALANDPPLVLADEPTANLDARTADQVVQLLCRVTEERQATLILATHDPDLIARAERLVWLDGAESEAELHAAG